MEEFIAGKLAYNPDVKCNHHEQHHGEEHVCGGEHHCGGNHEQE